jgi:MoaA/NifB/PqqE/SkfB family radical SAM enzyme
MRFTNFWTYRRIVFSRMFLKAVWHARQNVIADQRGEPPPFGPYMAELDTTYRCNCRCQMCQRWRDPRRGELSAAEYETLAETFQAMGVQQISIAGGEPLLRPDIFEIMNGFSQRGMSVNLCTNGLLIESLTDALCHCRPACITISLDGASAATHDAIRGHTGAYRRIVRGIQKLTRSPLAKRPLVRVRMTINTDNQSEIKRFYRKWAPVADDVLLQPVHSCQEAFYEGLSAARIDLNPEILDHQIRGTAWIHDGYMPKLIQALRRNGSFPWQPCYAGILMVRIDPWGSVYPCLEQHTRIGSVREVPFVQLWQAQAFNRERRRLATRRTCVCWYNNTALIGHYGGILNRLNLPGG